MQAQPRELTIHEIVSGKMLESGEVLTPLGICSKVIKITGVVTETERCSKDLARITVGGLKEGILRATVDTQEEIKLCSPVEIVGTAIRLSPVFAFNVNKIKILNDTEEVLQRYKTIFEHRLKHLDYVEQIQKLSSPGQSEEDVDKISSELKLPLSKDEIKHILLAQKTFGPINVDEIRKDYNLDLKTITTTLRLTRRYENV